MASFIFPKVIGHRGACGYAPENTLASFNQALIRGVRWVEFDVMLSQDNEAVIIHDNSVKRTTNGRGQVGKLSLSRLRQLDAGSWFDPGFAGEKIPTLREVIAFLIANQLNANIEVKPYPGTEQVTALKTLEILGECWGTQRELPLLSSFSLESMHTLKNGGRYPLGMLMHRWDDGWQTIADELACVAVHLNHRIINLKRIKEIKNTGRSVLAYTVNDASYAQKLFALGVDAVFSDFPDRILRTI